MPGTSEENKERAYVAASRRGDRSIEARVKSALMASAVHKKRTGKSLHITELLVLNEDMYEEEESRPLPRSFCLAATRASQGIGGLDPKRRANTAAAVTAQLDSEWRLNDINRLFAQTWGPSLTSSCSAADTEPRPHYQQQWIPGGSGTDAESRCSEPPDQQQRHAGYRDSNFSKSPIDMDMITDDMPYELASSGSADGWPSHIEMEIVSAPKGPDGGLPEQQCDSDAASWLYIFNEATSIMSPGSLLRDELLDDALLDDESRKASAR